MSANLLNLGNENITQTYIDTQKLKQEKDVIIISQSFDTFFQEKLDIFCHI
jgi:hypothetical protein